MTRVQETEAFGVPARVLIGAPSGADPVSQLEGSGSAPLRELDPTAPELWDDPSPPQPATFELKVHPGSTLSKICQDFYPEPRPPLSQVVEAVARWNGLVSPNDLRAGQRLQLPTIRQLFP